jgi:hypothetical protein
MARPRKRMRLEDGLKLDLNLLRRQPTVQSGPVAWTPISWNSRYPAGATLSGLLVWHYSSATSGTMRLFLGELSQTIDLVAAPRHFGGVQWHFVCPILRQRASVLWLPPGASCFASRLALGSQFAYASQFETAPSRALSRAHQIRRRLGDQDYISVFDYPFPLKPRGMHRNTYEAQLKRLESCAQKCDLSGDLVYTVKQRMKLAGDFD